MVARRLLLLAAVLMLLAALAAGLAPQRDEDPPADATSPVPTGGTIVVEEIRADEGANSRVAVRRGDTLELEVAGDTLDSVLLERLDRIDVIEPSTPARFHILVDAPAGSYPIRLVEADRRIGSIVVSD